MARTNFENLRVYRLSEQVADAIWDVVAQWPAFPQSTIGSQMVRAADSIGANIAEGVGRGSFQDNRRHVRIARGSLNETKHWLRRSFKRRRLSQDQIEVLKRMLEELAPTFNAYLRSISMLCQQSAVGTVPLTGRANKQRTTNNER